MNKSSIQTTCSRWLQRSLLFLLVFPVSTNYSLKSFSVAGGGSEESTSSNYAAEFILGETSNTALTGSNYNAWPGLIYTQTANVPSAPTLSNNSNTYYNKLLLTLNSGSNPSDATFAVAISTDNFSSDTRYVQSDNTVGATLGSEDWQTYTNWGSGSGENIIGLNPATTYYVKVKARQGEYTEGPWSATTSTATASLSLSFDIDVSSSDTETAAPYTVALGTLTSGSVTTASEKIWVDLTTNAVGGGTVYAYGSNAGLLSAGAGYTISAVTGNLAALSEGFGLRSNSVAESSGGPLAAQSPFNGASDTVGIITTVPQAVFTSSSAPITSGRGSLLTKAKITAITPAATDYSETLTLIAAGTF